MTSRISRPLFAAAAGFAAVAGVLVAAYYSGPVGRWDATALEGMRTFALNHHWLWMINDAIAHSADALPVALMTGCLCIAGMAWGRRRQVAGALVLVAGSGVVAGVLKVVAAHPRYQPVLAAHQLESTAFPSGHATAAMSVALAAVMIVPGRWRLAAGVAGAGYALAVAIALMTQGWHFPSDLLAGFLIAGSVSMLVLAGLRALEGRPASGSRERLLSPSTARILPLAGAAAAIAVGALLVAAGGELAALAASHTSSVLAALGVALGAVGVVCGVTAELETP